MARRLRRHVFDNVVGYLALFFALGGSAYAVGAGDSGPRARAASDTSVIGRFNDGPVGTTDSFASLLSARVPAGRYVIFAKAVVPNDARLLECRVVAGGDFDRARVHNNGGLAQETLTLTVLHRSDASFTARFGCFDNDPSSRFNLTDLKVTALRVNRFSNQRG